MSKQVLFSFGGMIYILLVLFHDRVTVSVEVSVTNLSKIIVKL